MTVTTRFDADALRRGLVDRDLDALLSVYADDAVITSVDRVNTPAAPRVLRGREEIAAHLADVCGRDMTHDLERLVVGTDTVAFTEACRYADGMNVRCIAIADLDADGRIVRQVDASSWD